jgi:hypothetical protein
VLLPRQKRHLQQLLSRKPSQQTLNQLSEVDDDDNYDIVDLDLHRSYSRPKLVSSNLWDDDSELPDHIIKRLELARMSALEAYRNKYVL